MTPARRCARACRIMAAGLSLSAAYGVTHYWLYGLPGVVSASVLLAVAQSYSDEDRRIRARHEQLRRAALSDEQLLPPPVPCCSFWRTSGGEVHGPDCTRPPNACTSLTADHDHGTAA
ncbi:hypothetical protein ACWGKA_30630 [Streptomyces luteogriseus]